MSHKTILAHSQCHNWRLCAECLRITPLEKCSRCDGETCDCPSCRGNMIALIGGVRDCKFLFDDSACEISSFNQDCHPLDLEHWCPDCGFGDIDHSVEDPNYALASAIQLWGRKRISGDCIMEVLSEILLHRDED